MSRGPRSWKALVCDAVIAVGIVVAAPWIYTLVQNLRFDASVLHQPITAIEIQPNVFVSSTRRISDPSDIQAVVDCVLHSDAPGLAVSYPLATCRMDIVFRSGTVKHLMVSPTLFDVDDRFHQLDYATIRWDGEDRICSHQPFSRILRRIQAARIKG